MILPAPPLRHLQRVRGAIVEGTKRTRRSQGRSGSRKPSTTTAPPTRSCTIPKNKWVWLCGTVAVIVIYLSIVGHLHQQSIQGDLRGSADDTSNLPATRENKKSASDQSPNSNGHSKPSSATSISNTTLYNDAHNVGSPWKEPNSTVAIEQGGIDAAPVASHEQQHSTTLEQDTEMQASVNPGTAASKNKRRGKSHA